MCNVSYTRFWGTGFQAEEINFFRSCLYRHSGKLIKIGLWHRQHRAWGVIWRYRNIWNHKNRTFFYNETCNNIDLGKECEVLCNNRLTSCLRECQEEQTCMSQCARMHNECLNGLPILNLQNWVKYGLLFSKSLFIYKVKIVKAYN